jgi:hypothetical protein
MADGVNKALRRTDALDLSADQLTVLVGRSGDVTGNWNVSGFYSVASVQVVGPRQTGWVADTGTAEKTAHATYAAGTTLTFSASYVQAEHTALATRLAAVEAALQAVARGQMAIKNGLMTHGLLGA